MHDTRGAGPVIAERERGVRQAFEGLHRRKPDTVWSAPGRANLIGEHTDYNEGFVLPFAIEQRVFVAAGRRPDGRVHAHSLQAPTDDGSWLIDDPESTDPAKGWLAYPFGVARALRRHGAVTGVDLVVDGDVPLGAGLASSAALECAVASAISDLSGIDLSGVELSLVGQAAENEYVGVPTGVMDQLAALLCKADHALFLDTRASKRAGFHSVPQRPAACSLSSTRSLVTPLPPADMPAVGARVSWQPSDLASLRFAISSHLTSSPQTSRCTTSDSRAACGMSSPRTQEFSSASNSSSREGCGMLDRYSPPRTFRCETTTRSAAASLT